MTFLIKNCKYAYINKTGLYICVYNVYIHTHKICIHIHGHNFLAFVRMMGSAPEPFLGILLNGYVKQNRL